MRLLYMKPKLVDLSQGSRIAFVRQFRHMTQDEVSDRLGVTGECKRRTMTRYEKGNRNPKEDRIKDLANILNVSVNSIKQYNYKKPIDLIYSLMWLEELIPNYIIDISKVAFTDEQYIRLFKISFENGVLYGTGNVLGYDKVGKEMIVNKEQAKTVKFIFESFLKGLGTTAIKCELEKNHILTATGLTKWNTATITRILQNPFYCGTIIYRKSYVPDFLEQKPCKNNGNVEQVIVEGTHEKIISKEDFEKAQAILKQHSQHLKNGRKVGRTAFQNVWSKKLVCKCGSKYNRRVYHKNDDVTTYCYQCYNQKNNGSTSQRIKRGLDVIDSCNIPSVPEWKLSLIANSIFELLCKDKEKLLSLANELLEQNVEDKVVESNDEIAELNAKLLNSNKKLEKLLDLYLNEMMTKDAYVNKKQEVEESIRLIKQKLDKLTANEVNAPATLTDKVKDLKRLLCYKISDENSCISDSLIEGLIEKVIVDEDKFTVKIVSSSMVSTETTLLAKLVITKDDVAEYSRKHSQYKKLRIKNPILVELVI